MKDEARARELAQTMVGLGAAHGVRTTALLTQMDVPLGRSAGNALEVTESVEVLAGGGPADLVELTVALAREMLALAGLDAVDPGDRPGRRAGRWTRGRPWCDAQGGDPDAPLPRATEVEIVAAPATGHAQPARRRWPWAWPPGASAPGGPARRTRCRRRPASCGDATVGDAVVAGQPLLELHVDDPARLPGALAALEAAIEVSPAPVARPEAGPRPRQLTVRQDSSIGAMASSGRAGRSRGPGRRRTARRRGRPGCWRPGGSRGPRPRRRRRRPARRGPGGPRRSSRPGWAARPRRRGPGTRPAAGRCRRGGGSASARRRWRGPRATVPPARRGSGTRTCASRLPGRPGRPRR